MPDSPIVSPEWLHEHLGDPHIKVLDASWYLPGDPRDPQAEFLEARIPGAAFFDIDAIADHDDPLPHMVPSPEAFALAVEQLGVSTEDTVVVYHAAELVTAPRAWWMFRLFGHGKVFVLDGGLRRWRAEGRPVEHGPWATPDLGRFTPNLDAVLLKTMSEVRGSLDDAAVQVVDARPAARFTGEAVEPRPGMRSGHMPGAINLPAQGLNHADGSFLRGEALEQAVREAGIDPSRPVVASCGSGISACSIALALAELGHWDTAIYDGSWTEWGARTDTPVVAGP